MKPRDFVSKWPNSWFDRETYGDFEDDWAAYSHVYVMSARRFLSAQPINTPEKGLDCPWLPPELNKTLKDKVEQATKAAVNTSDTSRAIDLLKEFWSELRSQYPDDVLSSWPWSNISRIIPLLANQTKASEDAGCEPAHANIANNNNTISTPVGEKQQNSARGTHTLNDCRKAFDEWYNQRWLLNASSVKEPDLYEAWESALYTRAQPSETPNILIHKLEAKRNEIISLISPYQVDYAVNKSKAETIQEVIALIRENPSEIRLIEPEFTKAQFREKLIDVYRTVSVTEHPASERIDKIMELVWPFIKREQDEITVNAERGNALGYKKVKGWVKK